MVHVFLTSHIKHMSVNVTEDLLEPTVKVIFLLGFLFLLFCFVFILILFFDYTICMLFINRIENTNNTYGTIPKSIRHIRRNRAIIDISNTHMDDRALVGLTHVWQ